MLIGNSYLVTTLISIYSLSKAFLTHNLIMMPTSKNSKQSGKPARCGIALAIMSKKHVLAHVLTKKLVTSELTFGFVAQLVMYGVYVFAVTGTINQRMVRSLSISFGN